MPLKPNEVADLVERRLRFKYFTHAFTAATTLANIEHKLNREPLRWAVVGRDAPAVVYGTADSQYLKLYATVTATVTLEVI